MNTDKQGRARKETMTLSDGEAVLIRSLRKCKIREVLDGEVEGEQFVAIGTHTNSTFPLTWALRTIQKEQESADEHGQARTCKDEN